jgi:cytochrome c oxidase assembly factor CtaG
MSRPVRGLAALAGLLGAAAARAHGAGEAADGGEAALVALLPIAAVAYALGWTRLRARSRLDRARRTREAWLFAAPLLALSRPLATMLWAFPPGPRSALAALGRGGAVARTFRTVTDPWFATLAQAVALWTWHVPALFERALARPGWHYAQHASFLATALAFWWAITGARAGRRGYAVGAFCLFVTSLVGGALGALMALSTSPWYAPYARLGLAPFGLTPAEDQQLAGLLMWIPGGLVHAGAALWMLAIWLRQGRADEGAARAA